MIFDKLMWVATDFSLIHGAVAASVPSPDSIDTDAVREISEGTPFLLHNHITEAVAGADIILFGVQMSDQADLLGGGAVFMSLSQFYTAADLTLGRQIVVPITKRVLMAKKRYMGASYFYQGAGTITAGKITSRFCLNVQEAPRHYPSGFAVT